MKEVVAGFDPGGKGKFGWCVVERNTMRVIGTGIADYAEHTLSCALHSSGEDTHIVAAGIDAPLYWTRKGDSRKSDNYVRQFAGGSPGTAQAVNSLRGACLIQGFLLAKAIESEYPDCVITETHPKALREISAEARNFGDNVANEDKRDALISAWAAAQCLGGGGQNLFCLDDKEDIHIFLKKNMYWWPQ